MKKVLVIVVVIGFAWWVMQGRDVAAPEEEQGIAMMEKTKIQDAEDRAQIMEDLKDVHSTAKDEKIPEQEEVSLDAVDARGGTATATRIFSGGQMTHTVHATVGDPQEGKFYEGWLVQKPPLKFYSTGKMAEREEGVYELTYIRPDDAEARYNEVVITEETLADGLDNKPEAHIFEGSF